MERFEFKINKICPDLVYINSQNSNTFALMTIRRLQLGGRKAMLSSDLFNRSHESLLSLKFCSVISVDIDRAPLGTHLTATLH